MVIFEMTSRLKNMEVKKVFVASYNSEDARLFRVDLTEAEFLADDMLVHVGSFTQIKRHTDSGFEVRQFQAGDMVTLTAKGDWKVKRSLMSCMVVAWKRFALWRKDIKLWHALKQNDLGTIERQIEQSFCYIGCRCR